jgi:solute carrier family 25 citrate transporter 1
MQSEKKKHVVSPTIKMLSGSLGGIIEACLCQPLDVAKTRLQLDSQRKYKGVSHCVSTILREEGARALYKGLSPFCAHLTLKYALRLGSFGFIRNMLQGKPKPNQQVSKTSTLIAGLSAGALEAVVIVTPFEVVKTRLQKQKGMNKAQLKYKGPMHCAATIVRQEGIFSLWKGVTATVLRQASNQGTSFLAVQMINKHFWSKEEGDGNRLSIPKTMVTGFLAGAVGPILNHPFDVVKSRLMAQEQVGAQKVYTSTLQCLYSVGRQEGLSSLYRGLILRLARVASGQAIMWSVVLRIESFFEQKGLEGIGSEDAVQKGLENLRSEKAVQTLEGLRSENQRSLERM